MLTLIDLQRRTTSLFKVEVVDVGVKALVVVVAVVFMDVVEMVIFITKLTRPTIITIESLERRKYQNIPKENGKMLVLRKIMTLLATDVALKVTGLESAESQNTCASYTKHL